MALIDDISNEYRKRVYAYEALKYKRGGLVDASPLLYPPDRSPRVTPHDAPRIFEPQRPTKLRISYETFDELCYTAGPNDPRVDWMRREVMGWPVDEVPSGAVPEPGWEWV